MHLEGSFSKHGYTGRTHGKYLGGRSRLIEAIEKPSVKLNNDEFEGGQGGPHCRVDIFSL